MHEKLDDETLGKCVLGDHLACEKVHLWARSWVSQVSVSLHLSQSLKTNSNTFAAVSKVPPPKERKSVCLAVHPLQSRGGSIILGELPSKHREVL